MDKVVTLQVEFGPRKGYIQLQDAWAILPHSDHADQHLLPSPVRRHVGRARARLHAQLHPLRVRRHSITHPRLLHQLCVFSS